MEKFTQIKINETSVMPDTIDMGGWMAKTGPVPQFALGARNPKDNPNQNPIGQVDSETPIDGSLTPMVTKSEPTKFISKLFESRQMMNVFHLQATGQGALGEHLALDSYYKDVLELIDELVETYQGQYEILTDYETIESQPAEQTSVSYMIELANFIKSTRDLAFLKEDTHLHNIIDEIVGLIYRTLYKLKNLN